LSKPVVIGREARAELAAAARWYDDRYRGLGEQLLDEVDAAIARVAENPGLGSSVTGVDDEAIRRLFVHRFPYHLVFLELEDRVQVIAVAHDRRRPGFWRERESR
jgi:plasmid stabilization system protein ParE